MFDLNDDKSTRVDRDSPLERISASNPAPSGKKSKAHKLDSEANQTLHGKLMGFYRQELERQYSNRVQQAIDVDYYDNIQWTAEEVAALEARGQAPLVYNVIKTSVDWIIGSEKRGRTDFKILPRGKEDTKPAEAKTNFLKYLSDVNRTPFHTSRAFEDQVKAGIGWLEDGVADDSDGEQQYSRYENWRNMLWDSASTEMDLSDCRYLSRTKWADTDVACAFFHDRVAAIMEAKSSVGYFGTADDAQADEVMDSSEESMDAGLIGRALTDRRERVRLIEFWYRTPEKVDRLVGGMFKGEIYNPNDSRHTDAVKSGESLVAKKVMMRMRVAVMTVNALLWEGPSPYKHNSFPFTPLWGYRRDRDGMPYGVIRALRDIQDSINKRGSKALFILSSNKTFVEPSALEDGFTIDDLAEEIAKPDSIVPFKSGRLANSIKHNVDRELAAAHENMMARDIQMIQQVGGVTDENRGLKTNAVSGVAIQARQEQGSVTTNKLFDNLRFGKQVQGEKQLSLVEQFSTEEKQFRITNMRGQPDFMAINDGLPENDIARSKADYIISETDWRASMRQAQVAQLLEMITKMPPQVAIVMLDLVVDAMDVPNREEIVKRIREINGMKDPDQTEPTQEDIAKEQAAAEQAAYQKELAMAQLAEQKGKAAKAGADAEKSGAEAMKALQSTALLEAQTISQRVTATAEALVAAQSIVMLPTIAKVGDALLKEAGWPEWQPPPENAQQIPAQMGMSNMQQPQQQQLPLEEVPGLAPNATAPNQPLGV